MQSSPKSWESPKGNLIRPSRSLLREPGKSSIPSPREPAWHPGVIPHVSGTWTYLQSGLLFVTGGMLCSLLLWLWLQKYLPKLPYFSRLVLTTSSGAQPEFNDRAELIFPVVGMIGR